ncbi:MAG TPA: SRPBCC domain-containing protein [Oligoflexus sp.]|uniref:SRPBCC family protein n=1 Tax=Oligoflexus sp. TaxID=1971216 RepID=UPI002D633C0B|nr:SRPBCC domain-containing protein [Oligoflexus sp.]HYX32789.1 SRPBCC domain-containing protein [Oligoflexus sp.]
MKILKILFACVLILGGAFYVMRRIPSVVHVERTLPAPVSKVWAVWTDPEAMKNWWSPKDFTAPVITSDFRVGGRYLYSMRSPKGEMFWNTGAYTEIVPLQLIKSTISFSDEHGKAVSGKDVPVPGDWPDEILVVVEFKEIAGRTQITITETGIPLIMKLMAKMGWEQQLDKLETLLR